MKVDSLGGHYQCYRERVEFYKGCGYDIEEHRDFIFERAAPFYEPILEIGTGKGYTTLHLAQEGYSLVTVDLSRAEQDFAQRLVRCVPLRGKVDFRIHDAEKLPFPEGSFRTVICVNAIHHFDLPAKVMAEALRVLRRGGKCIFSDFTAQGMQLMYDIQQKQGRQHSFQYFPLTQLEDICKKQRYITKVCANDIQEVLIVESR